MPNRILYTAASLLLFFCPVAFAQVEEGTAAATLYLYAAPDRSVWVSLILPKLQADPAPVSAALAGLMSEIDPSEVETYYNGESVDEGASWSGYWNDALYQDGFFVSGELSIEALRSVLADRKISELTVDIEVPETPYRQIKWGAPGVEVERNTGYSSTVLPVDQPFPRLKVRFGFTAVGLALWYFPLLACLLLLFGFMILVRHVALQRPREEAGAACLYCSRRSLYGILTFWFALGVVYRIHDPLFPLAFIWEDAWGSNSFERAGLISILILGTLGTIGARLVVFPVYLRFPDAVWMRRDFIVQSLWACVGISVIIVYADELRHYLPYDPARALAGLIVAIIGTALAYRQFLEALGFEIQALEEGDLRERVDAMADAAGIPRIRSVYLLNMMKAPMLNAFAANDMRMLFTNYLLEKLTRREMDAVIAHELTHLKHKHPLRLWRITFLSSLILPLLGAYSLAMVIQNANRPYVSPDGFGYWILIAATFFVLAMGGHLFRTKRSREFEQVADDGALALTGDADATISALLKLAKLNHMPLRWGGVWRERMITHPSTILRTRRISELGNVSAERMEALLSGEQIGSNFYTVPTSAARGHMPGKEDAASVDAPIPRSRFFNTQFKKRTQQLNGFMFLLLPGMGATLVAYLWSLDYFQVPAWAALAAESLYALFLCVLFQNKGAVRGYPQLARRIRASRADELGGTTARFVSFCPNDAARIYDGYSNWDIGLLNYDHQGLHYLGDATDFTIARDTIESINLLTRWTFYIPALRIQVRWRDTSQNDVTRIFVFSSAGAHSLLKSNRGTQNIYRALSIWKQQLTECTEASLVPMQPPPGKLDVKGLRLREFVSIPTMALSGILSGLAGFSMAHVIGLPAHAPLASSALGVGLSSAIAIVLLNAPAWIYGMRHPDP